MKFRKKPVEVEALQWIPGHNDGEIRKFAGNKVEFDAVAGCEHCENTSLPTCRIKTLEGDLTPRPGDWIIKGVKGELYPCKPDIFLETYEPAR